MQEKRKRTDLIIYWKCYFSYLIKKNDFLDFSGDILNDILEMLLESSKKNMKNLIFLISLMIIIELGRPGDNYDQNQRTQITGSQSQFCLLLIWWWRGQLGFLRRGGIFRRRETSATNNCVHWFVRWNNSALWAPIAHPNTFKGAGEGGEVSFNFILTIKAEKPKSRNLVYCFSCQNIHKIPYLNGSVTPGTLNLCKSIIRVELSHID